MFKQKVLFPKLILLSRILKAYARKEKEWFLCVGVKVSSLSFHLFEGKEPIFTCYLLKVKKRQFKTSDVFIEISMHQTPKQNDASIC